RGEHDEVAIVGDLGLDTVPAALTTAGGHADPDRLCRHAIVTKDIEAPVAVVVDQIAGRGVEYDVAAILRDVGSDARSVALATTGRDAHSLERSGSAVEEVDIAESVGVILGQRQCRDKGNVATIAGDRRSAGGVENTDRATDRRDRFG